MYKDGNRNIAVLEIGSNSVKFALGSSKTENNQDEVIIYYVNEVALPNQAILKNNVIQNKDDIVRAIRYATSISDESLRNKVDLKNVILIIPPRGVRCLETKKKTVVCDEMKHIVSYQDVKNVMGMVKNSVEEQKKKTNSDNTVVDIIPWKYITDDNIAYKEPPIGRESSNLEVKTIIYTVEGTILDEYSNLVKSAGLNPKKFAVENYCTSLAIRNDLNPNYSFQQLDEKGYFLIDIGSKNTTVSFILKKKVLCSQTISCGGDDLTEYIAKNLYISFEDAEELKTTFGYISREKKYKFPIIKTKVNDQVITYNQDHLNNVIKDYMNTYNKEIENVINGIISGYLKRIKSGQTTKEQESEYEYNKFYFETMPAIITGGGSNIRGLESLIKSGIGEKRECIKYVPYIIGARNAKYSNLLGAVIIGTSAAIEEERDEENGKVIGSNLTRGLKNITRN